MNGIALEYELSTSFVRGDEIRLRQALHDLIENAASGKYIRVETGLSGKSAYIQSV